jgi:hypothetical protein
MDKATELRNKLKPVTSAVEDSKFPKGHRSREAIQECLKMVEKAAEGNYGSIIIFFSGVLEQYSTKEKECYNYLESLVVNALLEQGFEVKEDEEMGDGCFFRIRWSKDHPLYENEGKTRFYLKLPPVQ